jgi:hypothetical protein
MAEKPKSFLPDSFILTKANYTGLRISRQSGFSSEKSCNAALQPAEPSAACFF